MTLKPSREEWRHALGGPVLVITGAGLSADSGLHTFRGTGGLWRNYNPISLATPEAFARDPKLVWEWYQWRRDEATKAAPNAGHLALAELATRNHDCLIVTQNVDDLHERAGTPSERLVHVHGDLFFNRCTSCSYIDREHISTAELPPRCPHCQESPLRPGVVWFGEMLDRKVLSRIDDFVRRVECGLVLVVGTTATFHYIIDWALGAKRSGGILVEINPEETELSASADVVYRKRAAEVLPEMLRLSS
ncbi:MAG TPA: NAD-dependent deacylase [Terriglobales bacterium]|jgi:NAD-dependent deacetylase|nr:NAD-dependent deacylase [Terriglobales bacterium]